METKKSSMLVELHRKSQGMFRREIGDFQQPSDSCLPHTLFPPVLITPVSRGEKFAEVHVFAPGFDDKGSILKNLQEIGLLDEMKNTRSRFWYRTGKRCFDLALGSALFLLATPIMLVAMLLVKLTSRGPAIYSQIRIGLNGAPFTLYKIRSMVHLCEATSGARWSAPGDNRVTVLGRFLRSTHIDELPQLWNVLRGDMSLVGPRPERPEFIPQLAQVIPLYQARLVVRPGLTGLAQVQLHADTNLESVRGKLTYDLHYVRNVDAWLDLKILGATALKLLSFSFAFIRKSCQFPTGTRIRLEYGQLVDKFFVRKM